MGTYRYGKYMRKLVDDYCVLDLETTGLEPEWCEIIEIAILRVRGGRVVDHYQTLVKPEQKISRFITDLTGITNEMVADAPKVAEVIGPARQFIGDDLIVGHNVSFDLRFFCMALGRDLDNEYADTMQLSRRAYPELRHHRLQDLKDYLGIVSVAHRAESDCGSTAQLYERIKKKQTEQAAGHPGLSCKGNGKNTPL